MRNQNGDLKLMSPAKSPKVNSEAVSETVCQKVKRNTFVFLQYIDMGILEGKMFWELDPMVEELYLAC